jgi:hypothetical protein
MIFTGLLPRRAGKESAQYEASQSDENVLY